MQTITHRPRILSKPEITGEIQFVNKNFAMALDLQACPGGLSWSKLMQQSLSAVLLV
jgi:hypothetical protein